MRKELKRKKQRKLAVKRLCKKYPWLVPEAEYFSGRTLKKRDWNYSWTWYNDMLKGWKKCFGDMMLEELDKAIRKGGLLGRFGILQLKEKYGLLTIYAYGFNDEVDQIINKYEHISANVCVLCGEIDVPMVNDAWISPMCFDCFYKNYKKHDKWCSENYKNYKPHTKEQIWESYKELTSDEESDWKIADSYTIRRFSKDGDKDTTYDISDTVVKIRSRYANHRQSTPRLCSME